jgi:regulator of chromosome condensation (RCC1) repeat-containing protein/Regulator of Chromosome Condensation (RCC1) repeat protein
MKSIRGSLLITLVIYLASITGTPPSRPVSSRSLPAAITSARSLVGEMRIAGDRISSGSSVSVRLTRHRTPTGLIHDCAVARDGVAYCWGQNGSGQLGDGTTRDAPTPQRVATNRRFTSIAAGGNVFVVKPGDAALWGFTCALTSDDASVLCWGDNRHGTLGNGGTNRALTPTPIVNP